MTQSILKLRSSPSSTVRQKHSWTFYALNLLIIIQVLLPKSYSEILGILPTRLVLMSVFLMIAGIEALTKRIKLNSIEIKLLLIPYLSFLLFSIPSIIVSPNKLISVYTFAKFVIFLTLLLAMIKIEFSKQEYRIVVVTFGTIIVFLACQGLVEYYFDPTIFKIGIERYVGARGRITTTFFNTIYYGIFINLVFVYLLVIFANLSKLRDRIAVGIVLALVYCNLIFTFTRSSFMTFWGILVLLVFFFSRIFLKKSIQLMMVILITLTLTINGSVSFVTTSFESTVSITSTFSDILKIIPDFMNFGKKTIPVVSIQLDQSGYLLTQKEATLHLEPKITPEDASNQYVIWSSSAPEVASVDDKGIVTALKNGITIITAKTKDGSKTASAKVTVTYVPVKVDSIEILSPNLTINGYKETYTINYAVYPIDAEDQSVSWSSSDERIAIVDQNGKVTALLPGEATITIKTAKGSIQSSVLVTVDYPNTPVTEIKPVNALITLKGFEAKKRINFDILPHDATIQDVTFVSHDESVVTVDETGMLIAKGNGVSTITICSLDQTVSTEVLVTVVYDHLYLTGISFENPVVFTTTIGKKISQKPIFAPAKATNKSLTWFSSDESVATVDQDGKVLPLKDGVTIISAVTVEGHYEASYELNVKQYVPIPDYSLIHRNEFAKIATRIGNDHFFTGIGFGSYLDYMDSQTFLQNYPDYQLTHTHPHSSIILLFAEAGALSVLAFMSFVLALLWMSLRNFLTNKNSPTLSSAISRVLPTIIIGFMIVCSIAENAVYDTQVFAIFLIITGLSLSYCASEKKEKTILYVASLGGHLTELLRLKSLFTQYHSVLVTEKTDTTKGIEIEGVELAYLAYASRANMINFIWVNLRNAVVSFVLYFKCAPQVIISTGANTAVPLCMIGKLFGSKIIYIETVANVEKSSITGKLIYPWADLFIVQWESMLVRFPKAVYWGWLF